MTYLATHQISPASIHSHILYQPSLSSWWRQIMYDWPPPVGDVLEQAKEHASGSAALL